MSLLRPLSVLIALAIAGTFVRNAAAAEPFRLTRKAESSKEAVIGIGARWSKTCDGIAPPSIVLDQPPEHGFLCVRAATVKPRNLLFGRNRQCLNTPVQGVQIIYRSRSGYSGPDRVSYTMTFPRGARQHIVDITVLQRQTSAQDNHARTERQSVGPAPECAALVS